ncbi:MAG: ribosomal RNA small subunit methyltransferase A [Clostridia bacterium]|nr:ribosomal RNA small subunit methyltransferase A [Clostridia bacterium]
MIEHNFKKKFGQNFITDKNLLAAIVKDSLIQKEDEVLEIGAGAGTLTEIISENCKKLVSYEIDLDLQDMLESKDLPNVKFVFEDALKAPIQEIEKHFEGDYHIVANLPYYITTPLIFKFLEETDKVKSLTIMVQKEVAERMVAKTGGKDYGILTVMLNFYGSTKITRIVKRNMFTPMPDVDSALVRIDIEKDKFKGIDRKKFSSFIKGAFSMRRKTLLNNLSASLKIEKNKLILALDEEFLRMRAEQVSIEDFINIYNNLLKNNLI